MYDRIVGVESGRGWMELSGREGSGSSRAISLSTIRATFL